jgi:hypothetical protein
MQARILNRIERESGAPGLFSALAERLSPSDLQSLLLSVYSRRAEAVREPALLARASHSTLFAPSDIDARLLNRFDRIAFAAAEGFEALDLSPVCPFGTQEALGSVGQDSVLTAIRNAEVLGDSTPALALECGRRRAPARLCASQRVVRMQPCDFPGYSRHFRLFALVSSGRDTGSSSFEIAHLAGHLRFYLRLFRALNGEGFRMRNPRVDISDLTVTEALLSAAGVSLDDVHQAVRAHRPGSGEAFLAARGITLPEGVEEVGERRGIEPQLARLALIQEKTLAPLAAEFPEALFRVNLARLEGLGYYTGLCLRVSPQAPDGIHYPVADGGFTDWTARLLQDCKQRLLTSGIGSEFVCRRYLEPED